MTYAELAAESGAEDGGLRVQDQFVHGEGAVAARDGKVGVGTREGTRCVATVIDQSVG